MIPHVHCQCGLANQQSAWHQAAAIVFGQQRWCTHTLVVVVVVVVVVWQKRLPLRHTLRLQLCRERACIPRRRGRLASAGSGERRPLCRFSREMCRQYPTATVQTFLSRPTGRAGSFFLQAHARSQGAVASHHVSRWQRTILCTVNEAKVPAHWRRTSVPMCVQAAPRWWHRARLTFAIGAIGASGSGAGTNTKSGPHARPTRPAPGNCPHELSRWPSIRSTDLSQQHPWSHPRAIHDQIEQASLHRVGASRLGRH